MLPVPVERPLPPPRLPVPPPPATSPAHPAHTVALLGVLALTTAAGRMRSLAPAAYAQPHLARYLSSIVMEWLLLGSVIAGIRYRERFFHTAFGSRLYSLPTVLFGGIPVYLTGLLTLAVVSLLLWHTPLHRDTNEAVVLSLMPHTPWELLGWVGLSATAGITEELIFRGYLLQQFSAWTGRPVWGIVLSSLLFGSVHLYEGFAAMLALSALAVVYALVVRAMRGDLRTVMVAHTLQDALVPALLLVRNAALNLQQMHHG